MTKDHDEIRDEFSPLLDGELAPDERAAVEQKLADDAELLRELDGLRKVDELYRQLPPEQAPAGLEDRVRERLQPSIVRFTRRRLARRALWPVAAAAALFVVFAGVLVTQFDAPFRQSMQMASAPDAAEAERSIEATEKRLGRGINTRGRQEEPPPAPSRTAPAGALEEEATSGYDVVVANGVVSSAIAEEPALAEWKTEAGLLAEPELPQESDELQAFLEGQDDTDGNGRVPTDSRRELAAVPKALGEELTDLADRSTAGGAGFMEERVLETALTPEEQPGREKTKNQPVEKHGTTSPESLEDAEPVAAKPAEPKGLTEGQDVVLLDLIFADAIDSDAKGVGETKKVGRWELELHVLSRAKRVSGEDESAERFRGGQGYYAYSVRADEEEDKDVLSAEKIWVQKGYANEKTLKLERESETCDQLLAKHKELNELLELDGVVVFQIDKQWYLLAPKPKDTTEKDEGRPKVP
jgi:anti-sigma factor RsiW